VHPHLIANPLVGLEVERQLGVVPLNDDLGGLLDGLGANATHFGDCECKWREGRKGAVGVVSRSSLRNCEVEANIRSARLQWVVVGAHS
jgi:hypothetical protein